MSLKSKMLSALTFGLFGSMTGGQSHVEALNRPVLTEMKNDPPAAVKKKRFAKRVAKKKRARVSRRRNRK